MRTSVASVLVTLASLVACSGRAELSASDSTVITVSDSAYALGQRQIDSRDELLRLIKVGPVHEPVIVNWSIRGDNEGTRRLAQARAAEVRAALESAGFKVAAVAVGNEIFEAKP